MLHRHLVLAFAMLLAACTPGKPSSEEPSSAAPAPAAPSLTEPPFVGAATDSPLVGDLRILGTEPFWAIDLSKANNTASYRRMGEADVALGFPAESKGQDGAVVLTSTSPQGEMVMTLRKQDCSDGMSDRTYPWQAEVAFKGETLKGCAATPEFIAQTPQ
jgi:uncharacterized membrane protein